MADEMSQIMSRVRFVVFLKVWDGESHVQVPDVFNGHHFVKLLWGNTKNKRIIVIVNKLTAKTLSK